MGIFEKKKLPLSASVEQVSELWLRRWVSRVADASRRLAVLRYGCHTGRQDAQDARGGDGAPAG